MSKQGINLYTTAQYTNSYLLNIFKKYILISTAILLLLFFKYMHINPVLLFPLVLNIVVFYIVKYHAPINIMIHIFIIILMFSIVASFFYITHSSFLVFLIISLMFPFLTFSLVKLDMAIVYNIILSSGIFVIHQYFGFLDVIDSNILLVFYVLIIIASLFFAVSRVFQVKNIESISNYLNNEIKIKEDMVSSLDNKIIKLAEKVDNLKIKDDITGFYKTGITIEFLHNEVIKTIRHDNILSVACIHINNYTTIQQLYGEETLEKTIKEISQTLRVTIRRTDVIGYFDQETFMCIMPHTSFSNFSVLSDKIFNKISKISVDKLSIDISIGVSSMDGKNYDIQTIASEKEYDIVSQILNMAKQSVNIAYRENIPLHHLEIKV
jgi:diguanylate cyclase (GGDEF)-like protein